MVHVKYPSMERQDLTQGQLGAFKFTPVDEAVPQSPQLHNHPHPLMFQQLAPPPQHGMFNGHTPSLDSAADSAFFNNSIRPSLDSYRLRLGTAATRAAVEGLASSPHKAFAQSGDAVMRGNARTFHPQFSSYSENESLRSVFASETNSVPLSEGSMAPFSNVDNSLFRALEAEQEAHETTKANLAQILAAHGEAEAENQRLADHNKALLNSIKLLQSTVKHMVQKESKATIQSPGDSDAITRNQATHARGIGDNNSILYDVFKNYRQPQPNKSDDVGVAARDLDTWKTPKPDGHSEKAAMQRTARQRMALVTEDGIKSDANAEYEQKIEAIVRNSPCTGMPREGDEHQPPRATTERQSGNKLSKTYASPSAQAKCFPDFVYDLPESFKNKYCRRPTVNTSVISISTGDEVTDHDVGFPQSLNAPPGIKRHGDDAKVASHSRVIYMPDSAVINWKIDSRHNRELLGSHAEVSVSTHFTDHPVRYVPSMADQNLFRTVMMDFIPFGTPYCDVLEHVRGGTLESIQLYGPIGAATDFVTARVVFTNERGANALYQRGQDPGITINGRQIRVWQVLEPTYPKNKALEEAIYIHGHTRILVINAPIVGIEQVLKQKLRRQIEAGMILEISNSHDGIPLVEFTSIEESTKALQRFMDDRDFAGADFDFDDDPCAASYA